jgi:hypothetical protein
VDPVKNLGLAQLRYRCCCCLIFSDQANVKVSAEISSQTLVVASQSKVTFVTMVYDPSGVITGVPGLIQIIAHACRRLKDLQDVVKGAPDISASLRTLAEILEDVIDEYKKSMNLINPKSRSIQNLERCINDCSRTCNKIDDHLSEIQSARRGSRTLKAWWEDGALQGFQSQLEKQKQSLIIHMNRIRYERLTCLPHIVV